MESDGKLNVSVVKNVNRVNVTNQGKHEDFAYIVVYLGMSDPTNVFNLCCNRFWTTEEHESLVDSVCCEIERETVRRDREVLPRALQRSAIPVEAGLEFPERTEGIGVRGRQAEERFEGKEV